MATNAVPRFPAGLGVAVGVVTLLAGGSATASVLEVVEARAAVSEVRARAARPGSTDGPGRWTGVVRGPRTRAPSGREAIAWAAWVSDRRSNLVCTRHALDGLVLEARGAALRLDLVRDADFLVVGESEPEAGSRLLPLDLGPPRGLAAAPASMAAACGTLPSGGRYGEVTLAAGTRLTVSACRRGDRLVACSHADYVAADGGERVVQAWVDGALLGARVAAGLGAVLLVLGFWAARYRLAAAR